MICAEPRCAAEATRPKSGLCEHHYRRGRRGYRSRARSSDSAVLKRVLELVADGTWVADVENGLLFSTNSRRAGNRPLGTEIDGYRVTKVLMPDGSQRQLRVHRAIWGVAHGLTSWEGEVNHKDGNRSNNRLDNLEVVSHGENIDHAWSTGLARPLKGAQHSQARLTADEVDEIRRRSREGESQHSLAASFGVSQTHVWRIVHGGSWA